MTRVGRTAIVLLTVWTLVLPGCSLPRRTYTDYQDSDDASIYDQMSLQPEIPAVDSENPFAPNTTAPPITLSEDEPPEYWNLRLEEAIQLALSNARVLRDLGGLVLRSPVAVRTIEEPAIVETDPRFGVEA